MTDRESLTVEKVWVFMSEGCSSHEIAAYGHVTEVVALAMMARAARDFAHPERIHVEPLGLAA